MKNKIHFGDMMQVSLSHSFLVRTKCRHCMESPSLYFYIKAPYYHKSPEKTKQVSESLQKIYKKIVYDYYLLDSPSNFIDTSAFKTKMFTACKPRYHLSRNATNYDGAMLIDCLTCKCRKTLWQFKQITITFESNFRLSHKYFEKKYTH